MLDGFSVKIVYEYTTPHVIMKMMNIGTILD